MIDLKTAINIHNIIIDKFGGSRGIRECRLDISASQEEKYQMVISASKDEMRFDEIKIWVTERLGQKNAL